MGRRVQTSSRSWRVCDVGGMNGSNKPSFNEAHVPMSVRICYEDTDVDLILTFEHCQVVRCHILIKLRTTFVCEYMFLPHAIRVHDSLSTADVVAGAYYSTLWSEKTALRV